ncbi:MAG: ABC transporter ATP-binding protein, partial [Pseudomonadales bacterium]|nr:ABC transporter ATP-binding protein [Pseudomonadales bacterium]
MNALFAWFESLVPAFPPQHPSPAPTKLVAFCLHYIHGLKKYLAIVAFTTVLMAVAEVGLYAILGQLVDWLAAQDKTDFFQREKWTIIGLFAYLLIFMPTLVLFHSSMINQGFMGNLPMRVRWLGHRYLLSQSWQFYQNEFSGRIATKLMQTSLGVRECILKLVNVLLFIAVYLISTIVLVGSLEWRLSLPLLVWIALYFAILKFFLPRLKQIAMLQADSRSEMTGRIVDSYTNVMTLKLFSQHDFDADYARHSMQEFLTTVHPQMRLVTWLNLSVWIINMLLIASIVSIALYYWFYGDMSAAAIAVAMSIGIRISGMSHWIMWEVSNLFENIGTVKDGLNTLSKPTQVEDAEQARPLQIQQAEIRFQQLG